MTLSGYAPEVIGIIRIFLAYLPSKNIFMFAKILKQIFLKNEAICIRISAEYFMMFVRLTKVLTRAQGILPAQQRTCILRFQ